MRASFAGRPFKSFALKPLAAVLLALIAPAMHAADTGNAPLELDLILRGGTIYTGDSDQPVIGDLGIAGDRIVFVGQPAQGRRFTARRTIDATGQIVAPGFIDAHTHADRICSPTIRKRASTSHS